MPMTDKDVKELRKELAVARRKLTRCQNEFRNYQEHTGYFIEARQGVCKALGVDSVISNENLLKLLKEKLDVNVDLFDREGLAEMVCARWSAVLTALRLPPDADEKQLVDRLVELSDASRDGTRVVEQIVAVLGLTPPVTIEAILAAVRGRLAAPADGDGSAKAALDKLRKLLEVEDNEDSSAVVREVEWLQKTCIENRKAAESAAADAAADAYLNAGEMSVIDGLKVVLGLPEDDDSDPQEYLDAVERMTRDNDDLKTRLNVAEAELTLKTAEANGVASSHEDVTCECIELRARNNMLKAGATKLIALVEVAGDVASDLSRHMKDLE